MFGTVWKLQWVHSDRCYFCWPVREGFIVAEVGRGVTLEGDAVWGLHHGEVGNGAEEVPLRMEGGGVCAHPPQLRNLDLLLLATRSGREWPDSFSG